MRSLLAALLILGLAGPVLAQESEVEPTMGPATIQLEGRIATIRLPKDYLFFDKADTHTLLKESGNVPDDEDIGIVTTANQDEDFWIIVSYEPMGYVKDDEAGKLDAASILDSIREGTEQANEMRKESGVSPVHVVGWAEEPRYDGKSHHVVWGVIGEDEGVQTVNYNTRVLGREGVLSLNMVANLKDLEKYKPMAAKVLGVTSFNPGKRYEDYQDGDKMADVGLMALVAGGAAAAKTGFLAKIGKFLLVLVLAGKKFFVVIVIGIVAMAGKLVGRKGGGGEQPPEPGS